MVERAHVEVEEAIDEGTSLRVGRVEWVVLGVFGDQVGADGAAEEGRNVILVVQGGVLV